MGALRRALDGVAVVDSLADAARLIDLVPGTRAVTRGGDVLGQDWAAGGSAGKKSVLEIQAAVDEGEQSLAAVTARLTELEAAVSGARAEAAARSAEADVALGALHDSDAKLSAVADQLGRAGQTVRSAGAEVERLERQLAAAEAGRDQHRAARADLEARWEAAESEDIPDETDTSERDRAAAETTVTRSAEVEARLGLRTAEERARATAGSAETLRRSARQERDARARAEQAAVRRAAGAAVAERVVEWGAAVAQRLATSIAQAATERDRATAARSDADAELTLARTEAAALQKEWESLTDAVHRDEVLRAQLTLRHEAMASRALEEFALNAADLVDEFGPHRPVPPTALEMSEYETARSAGDQVSAPVPAPYDRATTERRARRAERDLTTLGKVNPLALEEFAALEERHSFLSTQLEDLGRDPSGPADRRRRGGRPHPAAVFRRVPRRGQGVRHRLRHAVPRWCG